MGLNVDVPGELIVKDAFFKSLYNKTSVASQMLIRLNDFYNVSPDFLFCTQTIVTKSETVNMTLIICKTNISCFST